jgi:hypothetical protein
MPRQIVSITLTLMLVLILEQGPVRAQETTLPITPDPAGCVENLTIDQFRPLVVGTTVAASPTVPEATASPVAFSPLNGTPADEETVAAITARVIELAACINAENTLGFYSQFSPESVRQQLGGQNITEDDLAALAATTPVAAQAEDWVTIIGIREVRVLADGRVGALVDTHFPLLSADIQTDYFTFANIDGRWLIDAILEGLETVYPPTATPAA